jgi:hypothetical protein
MSQAKTICEIYPPLEPRLIKKGTKRGGAGMRRRRLLYCTYTVPGTVLYLVLYCTVVARVPGTVHGTVPGTVL